MPDDAFGAYLRARLHGRETRAEFIERDDGLLDTGGMAGPYFLEYSDWAPAEREVVDMAGGRVLDIGCGAGRHCLYLQSKGMNVTGIDTSAGAVQVCRQRGVKSVLVSSIDDVDRLKDGAFDTVLMLGANFGLLAGAEAAGPLLAKLHRVTSSGARILANTRDPYVTDDQDHLAYHERNRRLGKLPGQVRLRVRYGRLIGPWFDYLFVSRSEMADLLAPTGWRIDAMVGEGSAYYAVIAKR